MCHFQLDKGGGRRPCGSHTGIPAFLLQLQHIQGMLQELLSLRSASGGDRAAEQEWELVTKDTIPESVKGDEFNLWSALTPARVSARSLHFSSESKNFCDISITSAGDGKGTLPPSAPHTARRVWRDYWARGRRGELGGIREINEPRRISEPADESGLAPTPQSEENSSSGRVPEDFHGQAWPETQWGERWTHWFIGITYPSLQDWDGARVEELFLYEIILFLQAVGHEFQLQLYFFSCLDFKVHKFPSCFWGFRLYVALQECFVINPRSVPSQQSSWSSLQGTAEPTVLHQLFPAHGSVQTSRNRKIFLLTSTERLKNWGVFIAARSSFWIPEMLSLHLPKPKKEQEKICLLIKIQSYFL